VAAAAPAAGAPAAGCTALDKGVDGITVDCAEQYLVSPKTTCKKPVSQVPDEIFPNCPGKPSYKAKTTATKTPLCHLTGGKAPVFKDQVASVNKGAAGYLTPTQALRNAKDVMDQRLWYTQCGNYNYWRLDCVGLVARAWNLHITQAYTTGSLTSLSKEIDCKTMVPGDILNSKPHVMMFHHWTNKDKGEMMVWQASSQQAGHIQSTTTIDKQKKSAYVCRRYNQMKVDGKIDPKQPLFSGGADPKKK